MLQNKVSSVKAASSDVTCGGAICDPGTTPYCSADSTCVACYRDSHCAHGQCEQHECVMPSCTSDADCLGSLVCSEGVCGTSSSSSSSSSSTSSLVSRSRMQGANQSCSPTRPCADGMYCTGSGVCAARSSASGTYVTKNRVPSMVSLSREQQGAYVLANTPGAYPFAFSLLPDEPDRYRMVLHHGRRTEPALAAGTVYWYALGTEAEQVAFSAVRDYTGQELTEDSYVAIAHRAGSVINVLRLYNPDRPHFLALSKHFVQASVTRAAAGQSGFTHVLWVS